MTDEELEAIEVWANDGFRANLEDTRALVTEVRRLRANPLAGLRSVERPGAFEGVYEQE